MVNTKLIARAYMLSFLSILIIFLFYSNLPILLKNIHLEEVSKALPTSDVSYDVANMTNSITGISSFGSYTSIMIIVFVAGIIFVIIDRMFGSVRAAY